MNVFHDIAHVCEDVHLNCLCMIACHGNDMNDMCVWQHLLLTSLEATTRKAAKSMISNCLILQVTQENMPTVTHEDSFA